MTTALEASEKSLVSKFGEARRQEIRTILADAIIALASTGLEDANQLRHLSEAKCDERLSRI